MLPMTCIQPPCMNIEVNAVAQSGTRTSSAGRCALSNSTAGMAPSANTACRWP